MAAFESMLMQNQFWLLAYLFWILVGWTCFVSVLFPGRRKLQAVLLAPIFGVATVVVAMIFLRSGAEPESTPPVSTDVRIDDENPTVLPQVSTEVRVDVENPTVRTSGMDADGWVGARSSFELARTSTAEDVVVRGVVPLIDDDAFSTELRLLLDDQEVARRTLGVGEFELRIPAPAGADGRQVELQFSAVQQLPAPDSRHVAAWLHAIGFEASTPAPPEPPQAIRDVQVDLADPSLRPSGIDPDGWLAERSAVDLAQPSAPCVILVKGVIPLIADPGFSTELRVLIDGHEAGRQALGVGEFEMRVPAPAGADRRRVELRFSAVQRLPAPDGRPVGARIEALGFEAVPAESR